MSNINILAVALNGIAALMWTTNAINSGTWQYILLAVVHGILAILNIR